MLKPFSQACQNNRDAILTGIRPFLEDKKTILEIGSGTGQHAVYFAEHMPQLIWQTSDLIDNHDGISEWIEDSGLANVLKPIHLDVNQTLSLTKRYDAIFTANTLHIMDMPTVENCLIKSATLLADQGLFIAYGPFKYNGEFTSESNARFEQWLKTSEPSQGIRDFEVIDGLLGKQGFTLLSDIKMPANNQLIIWAYNA